MSPDSLDPDQALERLGALSEAGERAIVAASSSEELERERVRYLGRKAELPQILRAIPQLPPERRGELGKVGNQARAALETLVEARALALEAAELESRLAQDRIDVTLPGDPIPTGYLHVLTSTRREIEDVFTGMGYRVVEGPEVELDYYNFTALNIPPDHPARLLQDTFYFSDEVLLRTHTSPMQIRAMEAQPPPIHIIVPGKAYRRDSVDATHSPMFHQIEGLAVDADITLADLHGTLLEFARAIFGEEQRLRLRAGYFPFTEPSVEADVSCFACGAKGHLADGSLCSLCKGSGWIEIMGAGMVDPNVFGFVRDNGYDPERVQGFAFGMGLERIAMLRHGIPDLRLFFEDDLRFLRQF